MHIEKKAEFIERTQSLICQRIAIWTTEKKISVLKEKV